MFSKEFEALIEATLQDGVLEDNEKAVLARRAEKEGVDLAELEVYINSLLQKRQQELAATQRKAMKEQEEELKKMEMGELRICPSCGKPVPQGASSCKFCGHAFTETVISKAFVEFSEKLQIIEEKRTMLNTFATNSSKVVGDLQNIGRFISNYPVPNNRTDLLDFMTNIQPCCDIKGPKYCCGMNYVPNYGYAYWLLFVNCINKARINFKNDPDFEFFFTYFEQENSRKSGAVGLFYKLFH